MNWKQQSLLMVLAVALIVLAVQLAWVPRRIDRLEFTGDEPSYLTTTESIVEDGDIEESNNWEGPALQPHPTNTDREGVYSKHGIGLPLLISLPFWLGGSTGVLVFMTFLAALTAANISLFAKHYSRSYLMSGAIGVALGLSCPLGVYGLVVFPELPAALCVVYVTRRLFQKENGPLQWALMGAALAALPWLHQRFAFIVASLVVIAIVRHTNSVSRKDIMAFLSVPVIAAAGLLGYWIYLYGRPLPASGDHAGFSDFGGFIHGLSGVLIDQQWGILTYSPLLILAVATFVPFVRGRKSDALALATIVIPYTFFIADFSEWYGGLSAPGRFLTALVPLAAAPLAWWLDRLPRTIAYVSFGLFAIPSMIMMALMTVEPHRFNTYPGGTALLIEAFGFWSRQPLTKWLPIFIGEFAWSSEKLALAVLVAALMLLALTVIVWKMAYRGPESNIDDLSTSSLGA